MSAARETGQEPRAISIYRSLEEVPANFGPTVAAIGNFDGVHCGHRAILAGAVEEARQSSMKSLAVTFDPHPEQFLRPAQAPRLIAPLDLRLRLLASTGVDAVLVLPFDKKLARMSPRDFAHDILHKRLGVVSLHEGHNFRFGFRAAAGVKELAEFGLKFGWTVRMHPVVRVHGLEVSSTAVRELIAAGDVRRGRWMLGRTFALYSTQARGRGIGTRLLVPTVNLANIDGLLPGFGVYVTRLNIAGRPFQAVTNVGNRPTFGEASFCIESYILNFEPIDIDETTPLELEFRYRLRGEIEWPSPEALKQQIFKDVARAKRYFRLASHQV
jgi:riboflavin kinase / FMN adenylyltransferase